MAGKLLNGLMFNLTWLLIVTSQSAPAAWLLALLHVALHMRFLGLGRGEWRFICVLTGFGMLLDQLLFAGGLLLAAGGSTPLRLSALWPVLATTALHVFGALARTPLLAAALGAIGGYGSYRLGASLTEVAFASSPLTDIALACLWAALFPGMLLLARRFASGEAGEEARALSS